MATSTPHRQLSVPFPELQLLKPILHLDFSSPIKVILLPRGTEGQHASSDTAQQVCSVLMLHRQQNMQSQPQVSSILESLNSGETDDQLCMDQILPSKTGQADTPIIK